MSIFNQGFLIYCFAFTAVFFYGCAGLTRYEASNQNTFSSVSDVIVCRETKAIKNFPKGSTEEKNYLDAVFEMQLRKISCKSPFQDSLIQNESLKSSNQKTDVLSVQRVLEPSLSERFSLAEENRKNNIEAEKLRYEQESLRLRQSELALQLSSIKKTPDNYANALNAHALIIGNASYKGSSRLSNPVNDAKAISSTLRSLGFTVTESLDADRTKLVTSLSQFSKAAANADITLLFYAGHGVQISGTNYMLPIDLNLNDLSQVPLQGVSLNSVVEQYLPGKTKLVFLDACRDNPLMQTASRSVSRGLAPINVSEGTLIAYSTKDGQVAQDGDGKNSPFTTALLQHLGDPDDIAVVLRKVREKVMKNTGGKQQPWEYGSLTGGALVLSAIKPIK